MLFKKSIPIHIINKEKQQISIFLEKYTESVGNMLFVLEI